MARQHVSKCYARPRKNFWNDLLCRLDESGTDRIKWLASVNTVIIVPAPSTVGNLLASWASNSISKMNLSRRKVYSASTDHAEFYIFRWPVARSEVFVVVCSTLSFCPNTEHSQQMFLQISLHQNMTGNRNQGRRENKGPILFQGTAPTSGSQKLRKTQGRAGAQNISPYHRL